MTGVKVAKLLVSLSVHKSVICKTPTAISTSATFIAATATHVWLKSSTRSVSNLTKSYLPTMAVSSTSDPSNHALQDAAVADLITELERLSQKKGNNQTLPSSQWLYRIGLVLSRWDPESLTDEPAVVHQLIYSYQEFISKLPKSYLQRYFDVYSKGLSHLLEQKAKTSPSSSGTALEEAIRSLRGLLSHSSSICPTAVHRELIRNLASIYDWFVLSESDATTNPGMRTLSSPKASVLACLSYLLLDGIVEERPQRYQEDQQQQKKQKDLRRPLEETILDYIQVMEEQSIDCLGDLQEWQQTEEPRHRTLEGSLRHHYKSSNRIQEDGETAESSPQWDYLYSMLESARQSSHQKHLAANTAASTSNPPESGPSRTTTTKSNGSSVTAADEVERRIQQVQQILPDFGAGFIEVALSLYHGNVEQTVQTLLNDPSQYPIALQVLDRQLPRRQKYRSTDDVVASQEARTWTKEHARIEQQQETERYQALMYVAQQEDATDTNENTTLNLKSTVASASLQDVYNDDYDDQYDDMDGGLGGADSGWLDNDESNFDAIRLYNQVARQEEAEDKFWQKNRNLNRGLSRGDSTKQEGGDEHNEENEGSGGGKSWGPDKIKGGRILGPDGKVVKRPGRGRKQQNNNGSNNNQASVTGGGGGGQTRSHGKGKSPANNIVNSDVSSNATSSNPSQPNAGNKGKPRTKPKANNRVNRQRDKKQKAQGVFGADS